jgi:hypothetical protein
MFIGCEPVVLLADRMDSNVAFDRRDSWRINDGRGCQADTWQIFIDTRR